MSTAKPSAPKPKKVALTRIKKLVKDFQLIGKEFRLSKEKLKAWDITFEKLPAAERAGTAQELIALAVRFDREGGAEAAMGVAQLCYFAAGLMANEGQAKTKKSWGK